MYFGSRKNKDNVFRRFFESFKQSVERFCCEHMNLVDDVHTVLSTCRSESNLVDNASDVVDFTIRRSVHFNNVEDFARVNAFTVFAHTARIRVNKI